MKTLLLVALSIVLVACGGDGVETDLGDGIGKAEIEQPTREEMLEKLASNFQPDWETRETLTHLAEVPDDGRLEIVIDSLEYDMERFKDEDGDTMDGLDIEGTVHVNGNSFFSCSIDEPEVFQTIKFSSIKQRLLEQGFWMIVSKTEYHFPSNEQDQPYFSKVHDSASCRVTFEEGEKGEIQAIYQCNKGVSKFHLDLYLDPDMEPTN